MSDLLKEFTAFSERLEHFILSFSAKTNLVNVRVDSKILRWSKKPNLGDFSVAAAVADRLKIKDSKVFSDALLKESLHWPLPIDTCALTEQGALGFKLHRPSIFKKVLNGVVLEGDNYGQFAGKGADVTPVGVGIIISSLARVETGDIASQVDQDLTLGQLRGLLLTEHLSALLKTAGFQVSRLTPATYSSEILDRFGIKPFDTCGTEATASQELKTETQDRLVSKASRCKFRTDKPRSEWQEGMNSDQRSSEDFGAGQADCTFRDGDPKAARLLNRADISLDLHQFILDEKLPLGKSGYDKNLQKVKVVLPDGSPSPILMQCSFIEDSLSQTNPQPSHVIHVASQGSCFQQQQAALAWRLCSTRASAETIHQHHLTHGPVTARKAESKGKEDISAAELLQVREMQTRKASVLKYGEEVQGEGWDQLIRRLAIAGLKFEILGKQCGHMLKVELSNSRNSSTWPDSRDGVFVMYNYARLCTLFSHFEEEVAKGTYPPLPDIASLDFGLLREDQEWGLLFHYILQYPVMLSECVADLLQTRGPHISIHTHRVCGFLVSLCRDLSSYYSHTHVLGEPRPHLVPVMLARLHLLKGVQQILKNGLSLLNIQPLSQM
ncbi:DALR anticodon-binding domain-containing protein 3-like [Acanthaster planci]|uniref:DALR anticodon-binding domain-containing protein 3-like n=1 Tax=Acanthaster planci TaxID=133434 RepID=A0A8B7XL18_ACAPL|nr:DALR anticodon-binding domain-containing protein 3-like [Acanthaster planci]